MSQNKVKKTHLERTAVVYIRQSSLYQVERNLESQKRQYQLVERAQHLGWPAAQCVVIDEDLGISGAQSHNRPGYQKLISMLALREVGIVFGLEVSRLARNSLDWYKLLDLASAFDVLIADEDGLYDPGEFNDRLLLGLKGTISEVELHQIRSRMVRGKLNKAKRGELKLPLPIGMEWDPDTQKPRLAIDQSVCHTVEMVFQLFEKLRSIRSVLHYLRREGFELPHWRKCQGMGREIAWRKPTNDAIYIMITNPTYAGVYSYGKRERKLDPVTQTIHVRKRNKWHVFIPNHHPGYITLEQFEENQRILTANSNVFPNQCIPRTGPALLQGLVFCKHCGRKMHVKYSRGNPYYTCDAAHRRFGDPICNRAGAKRVDALVEELFLTVVNTNTVELSLSHDNSLRHEVGRVDQHWQEKMQRLEYAANLAQRRYEMVDPENRLVAQTLETEWNDRLCELEKSRKDYQTQQVTPYVLHSTLEQIQHVVSDLRKYWYSNAITTQDKKELLRCLIEQVFLESHGKFIRAQIMWYGGTLSELDVPKYLFSSPYLYRLICELASTHTDKEIASFLNQKDLKTVKGRPWSSRRVMDFRLSNAILSSFTTTSSLRNQDTDFITSSEAAQRLGVTQPTIQKWFRAGILNGKHDGGQAPMWIQWSSDVMFRLNSNAKLCSGMVSIRSLCKSQRKNPKEIYAWANKNGHAIFRLKCNSKIYFYISPNDNSATHSVDRGDYYAKHIDSNWSENRRENSEETPPCRPLDCIITIPASLRSALDGMNRNRWTFSPESAEQKANGELIPLNSLINLFGLQGKGNFYDTRNAINVIFGDPEVKKVEANWDNNNSKTFQMWLSQLENFETTSHTANAKDADRYIDEAGIQTLIRIDPQWAKRELGSGKTICVLTTKNQPGG